MTTDFMNFNGDSLDNYLGHEMIEINEESAKSRLVINKNHHQPMGLVPVSYTHLTLPTKQMV